MENVAGILFIVSLVLPVVVVIASAALLLVPTGVSAGASHHVPAHV